MSDPHDGLPSGVDPSDPGVPNDSSLGADRAAAIDAEKEKWRRRTESKERRQRTRSRPDPAGEGDAG